MNNFEIISIEFSQCFREMAVAYRYEGKTRAISMSGDFSIGEMNRAINNRINTTDEEGGPIYRLV